MRIVNRLGEDISYELKGGPLRMTLSKCDLEPGEEEVWTSPYKATATRVRCEVVVLVDGVPLRAEADEDALVEVVPDEAGGARLVVSGG